MLFNSISYLLFLPTVFILYWLVGNKRIQIQNGILLLASLFFYGYWEVKFLLILMFSIGLDFFIGFRISKAERKLTRKTWLLLSFILNLGILAIFKYYNFFLDHIVHLGFPSLERFSLLNWIIPVGISFYTFHGLSYVLDIYHGKISPEPNIITYALFVSFFPLLVAGPIERATHLLPQLRAQRDFKLLEVKEGLRRILWGLFKKMVVADQISIYADTVFNTPLSHSFGIDFWIAALAFSIQIYCDFSAYSDIALGSAQMLGVQLLQNFNYPYFSKSIGEFWKKWHMSLSSWFRDYLYFALGGNRFGIVQTARNVLLVFLISGFWHGANFTFIFWGLFHGSLYLLWVLNNRKNFFVGSNQNLTPQESGIRDIFAMLFTFILVTLGWVLFRSNTLSDAIFFYQQLLAITSLQSTLLPNISSLLICFICLVFFLEWRGKEKDFALTQELLPTFKPLRHLVYYFFIGALLSVANATDQFIYFQF